VIIILTTTVFKFKIIKKINFLILSYYCLYCLVLQVGISFKKQEEEEEEEKRCDFMNFKIENQTEKRKISECVKERGSI